MYVSGCLRFGILHIWSIYSSLVTLPLHFLEIVRNFSCPIYILLIRQYKIGFVSSSSNCNYSAGMLSKPYVFFYLYLFNAISNSVFVIGRPSSSGVISKSCLSCDTASCVQHGFNPFHSFIYECQVISIGKHFYGAAVKALATPRPWIIVAQAK